MQGKLYIQYEFISDSRPRAADIHQQQAQRELVPRSCIFLSLYTPAARPSGGRSPARKRFIPPSIEQPRTAGDQPRSRIFLSVIHQQPRASRVINPERASSLPQSSAAPRSGNSHRSRISLSLIQQPRAAGDPPRKSFLPPSIEQPRAAGAPIPQKQPLPFVSNRAAPRSGRSPRSRISRSLIQQTRAAGDPPRKSFLPPSIEQPRAAEAPQKAASSFRL